MLDGIGNAICTALEACFVFTRQPIRVRVVPTPESCVILIEVPTVHVTRAPICSTNRTGNCRA